MELVFTTPGAYLNVKDGLFLISADYDIESSAPGNKRRRKIIKEIESFGLYRVQKSVFFGNIERNRFDELVLFSEDIIEPEKDSVYLFPMCNEDYKSVKILGQGFDKELAAGKKDSLFF